VACREIATDGKDFVPVAARPTPDAEPDILAQLLEQKRQILEEQERFRLRVMRVHRPKLYFNFFSIYCLVSSRQSFCVKLLLRCHRKSMYGSCLNLIIPTSDSLVLVFGSDMSKNDEMRSIP